MEILCNLSMFCVCIMILLNSLQKPPGGLYLAARRLMHLNVYCGGFWVQRLAVNPCTARRLKVREHSGFCDELPGGDEFPPGDARLSFGFRQFWVL